MKNTSALVGFVLLVIGSTSTLRGEIPPLLAEALTNARAHTGEWAYTETKTVQSGKGAPRTASVIRYDPSKPYGEQYIPLSVSGAAPTKKELKKYRALGEQQAKTRHNLQAQKKEADESKLQPNTPAGPAENSEFVKRFDLSGNHGVYDLREARVFEENDLVTTYKIAIQADGKSSLPFEKILFLIRVNKSLCTIENISLSGPLPLRVKLIAKIQTVEVSVALTTVDAGYPPQISALTTHVNASIMGSKQFQREEIKRTDFKHVKPYDERFRVKSGPLQIFGL